jgi:hypothetical protein
MSKVTRFGIFVVSLLSLCGALGLSAQAVTWQNTGATSFTASGAPGTVTATGSSLSCGTVHVTGTVPATTTGTVFRSSGTMSFTGCTMAGSPTTADCSYTLTGTAQVGVGMGSTITGTTDVTCDNYISGTKLCHAEGTAHGLYSNTQPAFVVATTTDSVTYTGANCPVGSNDRVHLAGRTQTSTSANPPTITRIP